MKVIVVGGSMAGLLAATALSRHGYDVTILERDNYPDEPHHRQGVPHGLQAHILLMGGLKGLEKFFPNFETKIVEAGACRVSWGQSYLISAKGRLAAYEGVNSVSCTRPFLEHYIRQMVLDLGVKVKRDRVLGLEASDNVVRGVRTSSGVEVCDYVVMASGANRLVQDVLRDMKQPFESKEISTKITYMSRLYEGEPEMPIVISPSLVKKYGGALLPVENGKCILTMHVQGDVDSAVDIVDVLPEMGEGLEKLEPVSEFKRFVRTGYYWHDFSQLTVQNMVIVGDAVATFNPIYGQGMTVAIRSVETLDEMLNHGFPTPAIYQPAIREHISLGWTLSNTTQLEASRGMSSLKKKVGLWYQDQLVKGCTKDPYLARLFSEVLHLVRQKSDLYKPRTVHRVVMSSIR